MHVGSIAEYLRLLARSSADKCFMESDYLAALGLKCSRGALDELIFSLGHSRALGDDWTR